MSPLHSILAVEGELMTPTQRQWKIGSSNFHFEPPDILWAEFQGATPLDEVVHVVELYRELSASGPFFLVADMGQGALLDPESARYLSEHARPEWTLGIIYLRARLAQKALAKGILLAAHLSGRVRQSEAGKVHFVSTKDQAYALIAQLRAQPGNKVA